MHTKRRCSMCQHIPSHRLNPGEYMLSAKMVKSIRGFLDSPRGRSQEDHHLAKMSSWNHLNHPKPQGGRWELFGPYRSYARKPGNTRFSKNRKNRFSKKSENPEFSEKSGQNPIFGKSRTKLWQFRKNSKNV